MQATSELQFEASLGGVVPPLEEVRPGVWALPLAMPHPGLPYVLSYLLIGADGRVHVIDPGWASDENWRRVTEALGVIGASPDHVETVTVTHLHPDHLGLADRYRAASGARLALSRIDQAALLASNRATDRADIPDDWGVPAERQTELVRALATATTQAPVQADVLLDDGDLLSALGHQLRVIATPGHTRGSICIVDEEAGLVFTGDTVLPDQFPGLGLGGLAPEGEVVRNPVSEYMESLATLRQFATAEEGADARGAEVLPGHGWRFTGLGERLEQTAEHHERRTREAAKIAAEHPEATVWQVAERLTWSSGWQNLHGAHLRSALAQTAMHLDRVRHS